MPRQRTLTLTDPQRRELMQGRDHDTRPYVRERCAAILKIADGHTPHCTTALHRNDVIGFLGRTQQKASISEADNAGGIAELISEKSFPALVSRRWLGISPDVEFYSGTASERSPFKFDDQVD